MLPLLLWLVVYLNQMFLDAVCLNYQFTLLLLHAFYKCLFFVFVKVMQGLAKSIAWDGEGATSLIEVCLFIYFQAEGYLWNMSCLCRILGFQVPWFMHLDGCFAS